MQNETCQENLSLTYVRRRMDRTQHETKSNSGKVESLCPVQLVKNINYIQLWKRVFPKQRFNLLAFEICTHYSICKSVKGTKSLDFWNKPKVKFYHCQHWLKESLSSTCSTKSTSYPIKLYRSYPKYKP